MKTRFGWRGVLPLVAIGLGLAWVALSLTSTDPSHVLAAEPGDNCSSYTGPGGNCVIEVGDIWFCDASYQGGVCPTTIVAGDTVRWEYRSGRLVHTTTECGENCDSPTATPLWDSGLLELGDSFEFTFSTPGEYLYLCTFHQVTQRGLIRVLEPGAVPTATPSPTPTPSNILPVLAGDANCDGTADSLDAALILQYGAGLIASPPCPQNADVNNDGINVIDAALILQYSAGLIDSLPSVAPPSPTPTPPPPSPTPTPLPPQPDPVFQNGFEEGDLSQYVNVDVSPGNSLAVTTTHPHTGNYSLEVSTGGSTVPAVIDRPFPRMNTVYQRTFISLPPEFTLEPGAVQNLVKLATEDFRDRLWISIGADYRLSPVFFDSSGGTTSPGGVGPPVPRDGSWHEVQVRDTVDTERGQVELWLDGERIAEFSGVDTGLADRDDIGVVAWGSNYSTVTNVTTVFFDDVAVSSAYVSGPPRELGWYAEYFNNISLEGPPVFTRYEATIDYDWGFGSPHAAVNVDNFSARWTRVIQPPAGRYSFTTTTDDGVRLHLDGDVIIDQWIDQLGTTVSAVRTLDGGPHEIVMEYYEREFGAEARFDMEAVEGFQTEVVVDGLFIPTSVAFAPDGRIFIGQKDGTILVFADGELLPTPLAIIPNVNTYQDRGLISIALDPDFEQNGYLYAAYTHDVDPADFGGPKTARLIRLTVVGHEADLASEVVLLGTVVGEALSPSCDDFPLGTDCIPSDGRTHTIAGLQFLPDGTLLVSTGEGAGDLTASPQALRAQQLDSLGGKLLRINPDGTAPPDNPFFTGDPTANRSKVWAYGLRNPFRFSVRPETELLYVGDVGWGAWEELDVVRPGGNFGWPCYEANEFLVAFSAYQVCADLQQAGTAIPPLYAYPHPPSSASVTGGVFYEGVSYPTPYQGAFFFGDYVMSTISTMRVDAADELVPGSVQQFTDAADGPVQILTGPEGDIYYLSIDTGQLRHIYYE